MTRTAGLLSGSCRPLRLCLLFHLQDVSPELVEFLVKTRLVERVVAVGQSQSNICPVLWPQRVERGRKHDALLHGHVLPFVVDEVANDVVHILAHEILIAQDALDCLSDPAQTPRSLLVLACKIWSPLRQDRAP